MKANQWTKPARKIQWSTPARKKHGNKVIRFRKQTNAPERRLRWHRASRGPPEGLGKRQSPLQGTPVQALVSRYCITLLTSCISHYTSLFPLHPSNARGRISTKVHHPSTARGRMYAPTAAFCGLSLRVRDTKQRTLSLTRAVSVTGQRPLSLAGTVRDNAFFRPSLTGWVRDSLTSGGRRLGRVAVGGSEEWRRWSPERINTLGRVPEPPCRRRALRRDRRGHRTPPLPPPTQLSRKLGEREGGREDEQKGGRNEKEKSRGTKKGGRKGERRSGGRREKK